MGLLDEAIKEHLELKRRRGADPQEVAREEAEALGPVRRAEPAAGAVAESDEPYELEHDEEPQHEPTARERGGAVRLDDDHEPADRHGSVRLDDDLGPPADHPTVQAQDDQPPHGDPLADAALGHRHEPGPHQPTREFAADELSEALGHEAGPPAELAPPTAPSPEAAAGDPDVVPADDEEEDVLEETPEFLQETPEHDRLWFEQKPPKDFDF